MFEPVMRPLITILSCLLCHVCACAQEYDTLLLDGLEVKSFSEGIPAVVAGRNSAGKSSASQGWHTIEA